LFYRRLVIVVVCQKRLSAITLSLAGKVTTPTDQWMDYGAGGGSVPPSPLRRDFTSEPPHHAQPMNAIRKLNFQFPPPGALVGSSGSTERENQEEGASAGRKVCVQDTVAASRLLLKSLNGGGKVKKFQIPRCFICDGNVYEEKENIFCDW